MTRLDMMFLLLIDQGFYKLMTNGSRDKLMEMCTSLDYLEAEGMIKDNDDGTLSITEVGGQTLRNFMP